MVAQTRRSRGKRKVEHLRRSVDRLLIALATVMAIAQSTYGVTYHVSPQGSNTPPYDTFERAAHHPSVAISYSGGFGDTVLIHPGLYVVDSRLSVPRGLTIIGVNVDSTILRSNFTQDAQRIFSLGGDNDISQLTVQNSLPAAGRTVMGFWCDGSPGSIRIHDCKLLQVTCYGTPQDTLYFHDNYHEVGTAVGVWMTGGKSSRIFHNQFQQGSYAGTPTCILAFGTEAEVFDNVFDLRYVQVGGTGIEAIESSLSHLSISNNLFIEGSIAMNIVLHNCVIENNTILNSAFPLRVVLDARPVFRSVTIRNNAIVDCLRRVPEFSSCNDCDPGATLSYVHNSVWPPVDSLWTPGRHLEKLTIVDSGNFVGYPMFTSDSLFRLQEHSPLIDRGDPSISDLDGTRSDIGWAGGPGGILYEYINEPPQAPDSLLISTDSCISVLNWTGRHEADLREYHLYRSQQPIQSPPSIAPLKVLSKGDTTYVDTLSRFDPPYAYAVTAVDSTGLAGALSNEVWVGACGSNPRPDSTDLPRIARVYPNPVRETAYIVLESPDSWASGTPVVISFYDLAGNFVEDVFVGEVGPGQMIIEWTPEASNGTRLAQGVYLLHLKVGGRALESAYKVVLKRD